MWLLDTETPALKEFVDAGVPPYSILSHTWGILNDEVSFYVLQTIQQPARLPVFSQNQVRKEVQAKSGDKKIVEFCRISKERGLGWVGSTHAASTSATAPTCPKPSTPCIAIARGPLSVSSTSQMCHACHGRPSCLTLRRVVGLPADGRSRSFLLHGRERSLQTIGRPSRGRIRILFPISASSRAFIT